MREATARAAAPHLRVIHNPAPKPSVSALIDARKRATAAANRAAAVLEAFPEELKRLARIEMPLKGWNGETTDKVKTFYTQGCIDDHAAKFDSAYRSNGPASHAAFLARVAALRSELDAATAKHEAARDAAGYTAADNEMDRLSDAEWKATLALTAAKPRTMAEVAELAAYLRRMHKRGELGEFLLQRFFRSLSKIEQ